MRTVHVTQPAVTVGEASCCLCELNTPSLTLFLSFCMTLRTHTGLVSTFGRPCLILKHFSRQRIVRRQRHMQNMSSWKMGRSTYEGDCVMHLTHTKPLFVCLAESIDKKKMLWRQVAPFTFSHCRSWSFHPVKLLFISIYLSELCDMVLRERSTLRMKGN